MPRRAAISNDSQFHDLATQLSQLLPPTPVPGPDLWIEPSLRNHGTAPPSYDDSVADLPPDYTSTDALAIAQTPEYTPFASLDASLCSNVPNCLRISRNTSPASSLFIDEKSLYADIDFGFNGDGVRSHAKKKNKPAVKKPAPTSNAFDEPSKEEPPPPAESPGGGDPPADGGGAGGGDGGDGGDGDKDKDKADDDLGAWGDAGTKKKKKTKKQQQEEEAERLKKEEEEAAAKAAEEEAERIKKEEEEAAAAAAAEAEKAAAAPDSGWANDAPATDDWAFGATTSKKKKKKGKVRRFGYFVNDIWQGAN